MYTNILKGNIRKMFRSFHVKIIIYLFNKIIKCKAKAVILKLVNCQIVNVLQNIYSNCLKNKSLCQQRIIKRCILYKKLVIKAHLSCKICQIARPN